MLDWRKGSICHRSMLHHYTSPCHLTIDPCYTVTPHKPALGICALCYMCSVVVFHGYMVDWRRGLGSVCHENYLLYWSYMDLWSIGGGGWGQSIMKLIQCSGLTWIYGQLEEGVGVSLSWKWFGIMVFQRAMLNWPGGPSAKVGLSAKFELIYVSCFGYLLHIVGSLGLHW